MSMNEQTPVDQEDLDVDDIDLESFASDFFGQNEVATEQANSETDEEAPEEDAPSNEEDTHDGEDDAPTEDDDEDTEEVAPPKQKKNRFQERVDDLTGKWREAERREQALLDRLAAIEGKINPVKEETVLQTSGEPDPNELNADGSEKYPLGEFDKSYIRDLTKFTLEKQQAEMRAEMEMEQTRQKEAQQQEALQSEWNSKLQPAQERYPDFVEKGQTLIESLGNLDEAYGKYLADTLKSMEYGPDVLYYLASNPDEAHRIVNAGATKATVALGRLEAKFAFASEEKEKAKPKVSKAPTPPPSNKGNLSAHVEVADDTDDLEAFMTKLYPKRSR